MPDENITSNIRGYEIHIPYSAFIIPARSAEGAWVVDKGTNAYQCSMAVIAETKQAGYSLGMSVLTSQYTVVHLDTKEIAFSPYNGNASSGYHIYQMNEQSILYATPALSHSSTYDLSDSTMSLYMPSFNLSMSTVYNTTSSPSSSSGQSSSIANDATKTITGRNLEYGSVSFTETEISTINGSPFLVLSPRFALAWILGFL